MALRGKTGSPGIAKFETASVLNCLAASPCGVFLLILPRHSEMNRIR